MFGRKQTYEMRDAPAKLKVTRPTEKTREIGSEWRLDQFDKWMYKECKNNCVLCEDCATELRKIMRA